MPAPKSIRSLAPEFPFEVARRGYSVGTKVLQAVLPEHGGPTAVVPVEMGDAGLEERDGIEAKTVVLKQLRAALDIIRDHNPTRIPAITPWSSPLSPVTATLSPSTYCRPRSPPTGSRSSACMTGPTRPCLRSRTSGVDRVRP